MTKQRINRIKKQIIQSRTRLLFEHPFYALMLMHLDFVSDTKIWTMSTNGRAIFFNPDYLKKLPTDELDFILCHQVMHILFEDICRDNELSGHTYHHACDIVINSIIKQSKNNDIKSISLNGIGAVMHKAPNGKEGYNYTAEEVYQMLKIGRAHV